MAASRGEDVRNYIPALAKGAKIPIVCLSAGFTTGITSAGITPSAILNASITSDKISATAVHSSHISAKAVTSAKLKAAFLSGTIVSGGVTFAVAHGLGAKPKAVLVSALLTAAQRASATILRLTHEGAVSANTSTNVYIRGNQAGNTAMKYQIIAFG